MIADDSEKEKKKDGKIYLFPFFSFTFGLFNSRAWGIGIYSASFFVKDHSSSSEPKVALD